MKARVLFLCSLAAAPHLARAGDPVILEGPAESTKAEIDQCATALARRFAVAGLKGLKATAVEKAGKRTVEVTSKDEIPVETRSKIEDLARLAGQRPVLKFQRDLTAEEKAAGFDYANVEDPKTSKAPSGAAWSECLDTNLRSTKKDKSGGVVNLLKDNPYVNWSEVSVAEKGTAEWTLKLSAAATKVVFNEAIGGQAGRRAPFCFVRIAFDFYSVLFECKVVLMNDKMALKEATITLPAAMAESLEAVMRNPMPRGLKRAEPKK